MQLGHVGWLHEVGLPLEALSEELVRLGVFLGVKVFLDALGFFLPLNSVDDLDIVRREDV